jgi:hypothetical protein
MRENVTTSSGKKKKIKDLWLRQVVKNALSGDIRCSQFLADRMEGRPFQQIDMTTNGQNIGALPVDIDVSKITESEKEALRSAIKRSK